MTFEQIASIIKKSEQVAANNETLAAEKETLSAKNETLASENGKLKKRLSKLEEDMNWLRRQVFGKKSERFVDHGANTPYLFDNLDDLEPKDEGRVSVPAHSKKKAKKKGSHTISWPEDIPTEEVLNDLSEEEKVDPITGVRLVEVGRDTVCKLAKRPEQFFLKKIITPRYAVPNSPGDKVIQMPAPPSVLPGSKFDNSVMAHIVVQKICFYTPLNRICEEFKINRIYNVTRQTLSSQFIRLGDKVDPIAQLICQRLQKSSATHTDDTTVDLLLKGKGTKQCRIWGYLEADSNAPPYVYYEFSPGRQYEYPLSFYKNYQGIVMADAYGAYVKLDQDPQKSVTWVACWAHARRYFENATSGSKKFRREVLTIIRDLFMIERAVWARNEEGNLMLDELQRIQLREEKSAPLVNKLFKKLNEKRYGEKILPKCKLTKAIDYMLNHEPNFRNYLDFAHARMDNNPAERVVRKLVIGRKNWLFVGSKDGGRSTANLMTVIQSCRNMDINPLHYMEFLFKTLPITDKEQLHTLLPHEWKKRQILPQT